jgi:DnaJ-class molecular chaperone
MSDKNFYDILEVKPDATNDEIKKSYRRLSLKYHPDRNINNPDATSKIQKINEAYETLGEENSRTDYDSMLNGEGNGVGININEMDNIFKMFFGGMEGGHMGGFRDGGIRIHRFNSTGGGNGNMHHQMHGFENIMREQNPFMFKPAQPAPIQKDVEISFEESYSGSNKTVSFERISVEHNMQVIESVNISINIPKGIDNNEILIIKNVGNKINAENIGDLQLTIKIVNTTKYIRTGLDLTLKIQLSLKEALCGFSLTEQHISGTTININNMNKEFITKPNTKHMIKGLGMKKNDMSGDLYIEISEVIYPDKISLHNKEIISKILDIPQ